MTIISILVLSLFVLLAMAAILIYILNKGVSSADALNEDSTMYTQTAITDPVKVALSVESGFKFGFGFGFGFVLSGFVIGLLLTLIFGAFIKTILGAL
ncbi:MAG: hypothetical protein ACI9H6_000716 [Patiriisocius sp.]|jgi:hypothetical protein